VKLRLSETISSADTKVGQEIPFEVIEDVTVDQTVVLPKGSAAIATVTEAEHKKSMGRAGKPQYFYQLRAAQRPGEGSNYEQPRRPKAEGTLEP